MTRVEEEVASHSWRARYTKYFPFEVLFLLFNLAERLYRYLYQQYYFQRISQAHLEDLDNYTQPNVSICLNQSYLVPLIGNDTFLHIQQRVNELNLYTEVTFYVLSAITTLLLGSLSDVFGRKPILCFGMAGTMLMSVVNIVVVYYNVDINYYILTAVFYGGFGGIASMLAVTVATVLDTSSGHWVVYRFSTVEACVAVSRAATSIASNNWTQSIGCNFRPPSWMLLSIGVGGMAFSLIIPETFPKHKRRSSKSGLASGVQRIVNGIKSYVQPRYLGVRSWACLLVASSIIGVTGGSMAAEYSILNFFLYNKPIQWSYDAIGIFGAVQAVCIGVSLVLFLPILVMLGCSDLMVCLLGAVVGVVTSVLMGILSIRWAVFSVGCFQGFMIVCFPSVRSYISKLAKDNKGAVFAIVTSLQTLCSALGSYVSNVFYRPETEVHGHRTDARTVFWIMVGSWSVVAILTLILMAYDQCKLLVAHRRRSGCDSEKKPLLKPSQDVSSIQSD